MSHRPHIHVTRRKAVDGGESPNAYFPQVTAEIRVFWPTHQVEVALEEFELVVHEARQQLEEKVREYQEWAHG